jgi:hypothetical protein
MTTINPNCPTCKGRGWYEGPYYSDFQPRLETLRCPKCNPITEVSNAGCLAVVLITTALIGIVAWVMP